MEQKIREACIALAKRFAFGFQVQQSGFTHLVAFAHLFCNLLLFVPRKRGKGVVLGSDQERNGGLW